MELLIKNGTVVSSKEIKPADVLVKYEKIDSIIPPGSINDDFEGKVIDASGMLVMPGGVDVHTHLDMPFMGTYSSDNFKTGTIAAAMGGTTSIVDYVIPQKGKTLKSAINEWQEKALNSSIIDYGFHVAIVPPIDTAINEMKSLVEQGITSIKCFLAYKDSLMVSDDELLKLFTEAKKHNIIVNIHAENGEEIASRTQKLLDEGKTAPIYHAESRPAELEDEAVSRVLKLARETDATVYFVHLSSKGAAEEINRAKSNQKVFAETCPQYLVLDESRYLEMDFQGAKYVMSPPLRSSEHCKHLQESVKNKTIDTIATDHCPFYFKTQKTMGLGDFTKIPNGIPGIETRLPIMYTEMVIKMGMNPIDFVRLNCTNPASIFGLVDKGDIVPGKDADIIVWNPDLKWEIKNKELHEKVDYTPYEGYVATGKAAVVISRGEVIVENGDLKATYGRGKFIHRNS